MTARDGNKGDLDGAAEHYQEALEYDARNKYALYDLALIDAARSNFGDAEQKYRVVLGIDPAYPPALFNLAILLKNRGDAAEAVSLYRRLLAADPGALEVIAAVVAARVGGQPTSRARMSSSVSRRTSTRA